MHRPSPREFSKMAVELELAEMTVANRKADHTKHGRRRRRGREDASPRPGSKF